MSTRTFRDLDDPDQPLPLAFLKEDRDFGIPTFDLVRPPSRFWTGQPPRTLVKIQMDQARVEPNASWLELVAQPPADETVSAQSRRTLARALAWFLLAEDPQRRLDARSVSTLAHQASLVRHVLSSPSLHRVLIADEVGLGKTVEAALIIKELLDVTPNLRVLYLAPAGLVRNVHREFERMGVGFRRWVSGVEQDARLNDQLVLASIHRAVHPAHFDTFFQDGSRWDLIVVDECHHLSDWSPGGGKATRKYKLVEELVNRSPDARLILMSGTPHQGHQSRFENLLKLLRRGNEAPTALAGRVIYRTKDDVRDWDGRPLFPRRNVQPPIIVDLSPSHRRWLEDIHRTFELSDEEEFTSGQARRRARSWRCSQALQWATSSIEAGLGFLVRQAIRAGWTLKDEELAHALAALRPYREGAFDEPVTALFGRLSAEIERQRQSADIEDNEEDSETTATQTWTPERVLLGAVLRNGVGLLREVGDAKWERIRAEVLDRVPNEKVVLFAQPVETVTALARYLERIDGRRPAMIVGNQADTVREAEVASFWREDGPRFLVSSKAGGEGFNLQVARVLVHVDVPWNPMELEQRVGRVHRFMSRRTIQVHTVVVADSREVDIYETARRKLQEIAATLDGDRLEELFARVMALVPPDELQDVMVSRPLGPLDRGEITKLSLLVAEGFKRWESFHEQYSVNQRKIEALDPGKAEWRDVERFATEHLGARRVEGYSALRFRFEQDEVVEASEAATVVEIASRHFACGDFGDMPVLGSGPNPAARLGLNVEPLTAALRDAALPQKPTGAAFVRLTERPAALEIPRGPFGVLVYGRQSIRNLGGTFVEGTVDFVMAVVQGGQPPVLLDREARASLLRVLVESTLRREADVDTALLAALQQSDQELFQSLRQPGADRSLRYALFPLAAVVVS